MKRITQIFAILIALSSTMAAQDHIMSIDLNDGASAAQERYADEEKGIYLATGGSIAGGVLSMGYNVGHGVTVFGQLVYLDEWSYNDELKYGMGMSYDYPLLGETLRPYLEIGTGSDFNTSPPREYYPGPMSQTETGESNEATYTYISAGLRLYLGSKFYLFGGVLQAYTKGYTLSHYYINKSGWFTTAQFESKTDNGAYFGIAITGI